MQKYYCNICGNKFFPNPPGNLSCPSCASNNVVELPAQSEEPWWKNKLLIIPLIVLLIMLIVLFLLPPYAANNFEVSLVKLQKNCKFRVVIQQGKEVVDSSLFMYSANDGGKFQPSNTFDSVPFGTYKIKVEHLSNKNASIKYAFLNPFIFNPDCQAKPPAPCDCQKLQILSVTNEKLNGQNKVVVRATLPDCAKQYSFTGKDGPYLADSTFTITNQTYFLVWIKSQQCPPMGYSGNPHLVPVKVSPTPVKGNYFKESEVDTKPYPTNIGSDRGELIQKLREQIQQAGIAGGQRLSFIVNSYGEIINLEVSPNNQENLRKINDILNELGGWTAGERNGETVNTKVVIPL